MKQVSADGLTLSIDWKRCKAPRVTCEMRDPRDRSGGALCGPSVDHDTSDVSAHLRRERPQVLPFSLLSQVRALPQIWGSRGRRFESCRPDGNFSSSEGVGTSLVPPPSELLSD
jgi:hypothetical protein